MMYPRWRIFEKKHGNDVRWIRERQERWFGPWHHEGISRNFHDAQKVINETRSYHEQDARLHAKDYEKIVAYIPTLKERLLMWWSR